MEEETTMTSAEVKRSLHALSGESATRGEDRQKQSKPNKEVGSPTALTVEAVIQPRQAQ